MVEGKLIKYLSGYCKKHKCSMEEAKTHAIVQGVMDQYEHEHDGAIVPAPDPDQCECEMEDKSC